MFYNYKTVVTAQWKDTSLHRAWGCFCLLPPQVCREGLWPLCTVRKCPPPHSPTRALTPAQAHFVGP